METVHQLEGWRDLYVMLGTSAAALIGLLFVATSLHLSEIVSNPVYRIRSRNTTYHLVAMLIQAAAILTPQPILALGVEVLAINLCGWSLPLTFTYKAFFKNEVAGKHGGFSIYRGMMYHAGYLLGVAGGIALVDRSIWGMYLVTISYVTFLVSVIGNAWAIMLGVGQTEKPRR